MYPRLAGLLTLLAAAAAQSDFYSPLSGFRDQGVFSLYFNEERVATIWFRCEPNGAFVNHSILSVAGQHVTTVLRIDPPGAGGIRVDSREYKQRLAFDAPLPNSHARAMRRTVPLRDPAFFDGDYAAALVSSVVRRYDREKAGRQSFPVFIIPGFPGSADTMPQGNQTASLEWKGRVERTQGDFDTYDYTLPGGEYSVWADARGRICLIEGRGMKVAYVREGFESLREPEVTDPLLSQPLHTLRIDRGVRIRMRDGIELSTDIYRPDTEGLYPVILQRTPYKKEMLELQAKYYARRGYVFAAQDVRGRFASAGTWEPFVNEPDDGYDTIGWLAKQPWSTGKVGMIGASYDGIVQWYAAIRRPPALVTIVPNVSPPDPHLNVSYEFGVFRMSLAMWWAELLESNATADLSGQAFNATRRNFSELLKPLPVIDLDKRVLGHENAMWRTWIAHPSHDEYWDRASFLSRLEKVRIPVFHQSGWFDGDSIGSKLNYLRMVGHGHPDQRLVVGPWGHTEESHRRMGPIDFGQSAALDLRREYLRWFDFWLKGIDNGLRKQPLVSLFVMGLNEWLEVERYPVPGTRWQKWYLTGSALRTAAPQTDGPPVRYTYDPGDPTPVPAVFATNAELDERRDKAVFLSEPFREQTIIAGPLSAVLYASTSGRDTDWFASLFEIGPDGSSMLLGHGKLRARFRGSLRRAEFLRRGQVYEYKLDLWHTAIAVAPGHRLRVEIASSSFPEFSRNLNTGGSNETETHFVRADQAIYCSPRYPSHVLLPVITP